MLGHTEISAKCPNLYAAHDLLTQASDTHIFAALIEWCGVADFNSLSEIVASGRWHTQVEEMVADWLQLNTGDDLGKKATLEVIQRLHVTQNVTSQTLSAVWWKKLTKSDVESKNLNHRDIVFENAILFLIHSLIYIDFHDATRIGDSGRVEKSLNIATVMFQGSGSSKSNYHNLTLDLKASRVKEWTPEMHELSL